MRCIVTVTVTGSCSRSAEKKKREAADSSKEALLERKESREQHHKDFRAFMLEQKKVLMYVCM